MFDITDLQIRLRASTRLIACVADVNVEGVGGAGK